MFNKLVRSNVNVFYRLQKLAFQHLNKYAVKNMTCQVVVESSTQQGR